MSKYSEIKDGFPKDFGSHRANADGALYKYQELQRVDNPSETMDDLNLKARKREEWDKIIAAVKVITDAVNHTDSETVAKAMFVGMSREHRTLQALSMKAIFQFLKVYQDSAYDLRNWSAVVAAAQVTQFTEDEFIYFPLI